MGLAIAKVVLLLLQLSLLCFTVFGDEEIDAVSPAPYHHGYTHNPAIAPSQPPTHHHHHHHHAHPPIVAPSIAPSHHHHHGHPPSHAPVYPPKHSPSHPHPPVHSPPMPHPHPPVHSPPMPHPHPPVHSPPTPHPHPPVHSPPTPHPHPPVHSPQPHPHPPVHSPQPQPHPYPHPPVKSPSHPPSYHFPRSFVAVQGVVYCKSCKYAGVDTLLGASPLPGAAVKLQCNNTKYPLEVKATTDKNGYFFLEAPKSITSYGVHKCKASLVSAPTTACSKITNLHGGLSGGVLRPEKTYVSKDKRPFVLFSVGPFAFEPKCPR